jgi:hypothetical protein
LLKNKELFLLKISISKYTRKPCYMEVKIHTRIGLSPSVVKFGLVWPKLADFVAIVPNLKGKTFLKHIQLYHSRILLNSKARSEIKTCYRQKVFSQTTVSTKPTGARDDDVSSFIRSGARRARARRNE